ncbi:MAG: Fic family protein [Alphaproteobacteria bacterium]|jgi:Fic family protein
MQPPTSLSPDVVKLIAEIDEFKGRWDAFQALTPHRLNALRRIATIESVGSSTRIEGAKLTDAQVETLLANLKHTRFETRDEQEVAGYAEAMDFVFEAYADLGLTENHILQLHNILLRHSNKDERHRGDYKKLPNNVVAFDADGQEIGIVFETTTPFATPREMADLVAWARKAIDEDAFHPLLIVGIFIVRLLAIHPFQDGNGRLSRILTNLLLLRAGYGYVPYASLESVIEENKEFYYQALRRTQTSFKDDTPDWDPWIGFFLRCLKKQKDNLVQRLDREKSEPPDDDELPELSLKILSLFQERPRLTIAQITEFTGANRNTLKLRLRSLVEAGRLVRRGKARATWYALSENGRP